MHEMGGVGKAVEAVLGDEKPWAKVEPQPDLCVKLDLAVGLVVGSAEVDGEVKDEADVDANVPNKQAIRHVILKAEIERYRNHGVEHKHDDPHVPCSAPGGGMGWSVKEWDGVGWSGKEWEGVR